MKEIFQDDPRLTAYALGELEGIVAAIAGGRADAPG